MFQKTDLYKYLGPTYLIKAIWFKLTNRRSDNWHAKTPFHSRGYRKACVELLNFLDVENVLEVGCGTAEILKRLNIKTKFGFDTDQDIYVTDLQEITFLSSLEEYTIKPNSTQVLLAVNFHHAVDDLSFLKDLIEKYRFDYLVLDSIGEAHAQRLKPLFLEKYDFMVFECDKDRDLLLCLRKVS